ncbi:MAG: hypothetical protein KJN92_01745, partial [Gemmatimonadetes bacterium]|nr:hypothetical protein [Gemmatimonadota bacterium]
MVTIRRIHMTVIAVCGALVFFGLSQPRVGRFQDALRELRAVSVIQDADPLDLGTWTPLIGLPFEYPDPADSLSKLVLRSGPAWASDSIRIVSDFRHYHRILEPPKDSALVRIQQYLTENPRLEARLFDIGKAARWLDSLVTSVVQLHPDAKVTGVEIRLDFQNAFFMNFSITSEEVEVRDVPAFYNAAYVGNEWVPFDPDSLHIRSWMSNLIRDSGMEGSSSSVWNANNPAEEPLPKLRRVWDEVFFRTLGEAEDYLSAEVRAGEVGLRLLGLELPQRQARLFGPFLLVFSLGFMLAHLQNLLSRGVGRIMAGA